jgi:hypothetical protein
MEQLKQRDKPPKTKRKFCPKSRKESATLGDVDGTVGKEVHKRSTRRQGSKLRIPHLSSSPHQRFAVCLFIQGPAERTYRIYILTKNRLNAAH